MNSQYPPRDELDDLLRQIRGLPAFIAYSQKTGGITIWAPGTRVPLEVKRLVNLHRAAILARMRSGDASACADPTAHRWSWRWDRGLQRAMCEACEQLEDFLAA